MAPPSQFTDKERKIRKNELYNKWYHSDIEHARKVSREKAARLRAAKPEHYKKKEHTLPKDPS